MTLSIKQNQKSPTSSTLEGNHGTSLRFFNVVGAAAPELLDNSVENLVPIVLGKLNKGEAPTIFGTDYPTPDGTCIRDYVDVRDIARAHLAAANATTKLPPAMNIGTGRGASVREIIKLVLRSHQQSRYQGQRSRTSRRRPSFPLRRYQPRQVSDGLYLAILSRRERPQPLLEQDNI